MKSAKKKRLRRKKLKTKKIRKIGGAAAVFNGLELIPIDLKPVTLNESVDDKNPTDISLEEIIIPVLRPSTWINEDMNIYHRFLGEHPKCTTALTFSVGYNIMNNILSNQIGYIYVEEKDPPPSRGIVDERQLLVISLLDFTKENPLLLEKDLVQTLSIGGWEKTQQCDINRDYEKILCDKNIEAKAIDIDSMGIPSRGFHYILKLSGKTIDSNNLYRKDKDKKPITIYCDSTMYSERKFNFDEKNGLTYTKSSPGYIVMFISLEKDEDKLKELMKDWYSHLF